MMRGRNPSFWSVIRKTVERMKVRNPGIHNCCTRFFMRCPLSFAAVILRCKSCQSEACSMVRRADSSLPKPCLQNTAYDSSRCAASSACTSSFSAGSSARPERRWRTIPRSEEHTSELQSRFDLVCRLLLEKKKKTTKKHTNNKKQHN